jgi:hypothetical protein
MGSPVIVISYPAAYTEAAAGQLKKLDTAVASSGDADVDRFW